MVSFTLKAKEKIKEMIETEGENSYLRIYAIPSGCCGIDFGMELTNETDSSDTLIDLGDFKIVIDDFSVPFIENLEIDIIEKENNTYFILNPKEGNVSKCGCNNSNCNCC